MATKKTSIGTRAVKAPFDKIKTANEAAGITTDAAQMTRAIIRGERQRAKAQQKQLIKRIQAIRL